MRIAIFGLGYVGVTTAACLTHEGHTIVGVDPNPDKVSAINSGRSPIAEPGVGDLLAKAHSNNLLFATEDASAHLDACEMAIVCVGTPSSASGAHDMRYIATVSRQICAILNARSEETRTVVYRSTMRPGTTEELIRPIFDDTLGSTSSRIELVYNPEFLRESVAISDFFSPPKIVIGTVDAGPCKRLDHINEHIKAQTFYTHYKEAELTKFVDNTFHAVKVAFGNEIGRVCKQMGIDPKVVHRIFVGDTKLNISPNYFRPGGPFGGSCLPKDVRALQHLAAEAGAATYLVDSLLRSNEAHKHFIYEMCVKDVPPHSKVLLLGLAFKPDSDDLRESPNIDLARKLLKAGYDLSIYDPHVIPTNLLGQNLGYAYSSLPSLQKLLVTEEVLRQERYDLAIDTRGWTGECKFHADRVVDVGVL